MTALTRTGASSRANAGARASTPASAAVSGGGGLDYERLRALFVTEGRELVTILERGALALESKANDPEQLNEVFRAARPKLRSLIDQSLRRRKGRVAPATGPGDPAPVRARAAGFRHAPAAHLRTRTDDRKS